MDPASMSEIHQIRKFWESNPLFAGETAAPAGTRQYFEDHRRVYIEDCFVGWLDERFWPKPENCDSVLDLGCGPGFWTVELLQRRNIRRMVAADLTAQPLSLTRRRLDLYGLQADTLIENAEEMTFGNGVFGHVNCQGVIHHTARTEKAVTEIARVLRVGGTAVLSVYYLNAILRNWKYLSWLGSILHRAGARMPGRGRDCLYLERDVLEIVRLYDGAANLSVMPVLGHLSRNRLAAFCPR